MVMRKCYKVKKPLEILEKNDVEKIHQTSIRVLEEVGVKMDHPEALRLFKNNGCEVDEAKKVVKIKESLIKEQLKHVRKTFDIYSRDLERMEVGTSYFYMLSPSDNAFLVDIDTSRRRPGSTEDCRKMARLVDALEFYHICCTPLLPQELPATIRGLTASVETLKNMSKHYLPEPVTAAEVKYLIEMGEAIAGGREELTKKPVISSYVCPNAPLVFPDISLSVILGYAGRRLTRNDIFSPHLRLRLTNHNGGHDGNTDRRKLGRHHTDAARSKRLPPTLRRIGTVFRHVHRNSCPRRD